MRRTLPALTLLSVLLGTTTALGTVVRRASLAELVRGSAVIFHGRVAAVDDDTSVGPKGPFRTQVDFHIIKAVKGIAADVRTFSLELPGGRAGDRVMRIPGMPSFAPGDEVVVLLERTARGYALAGLSQGVFRVERQGGEARMVRELGDVMMVERGKPVILQKPPETLAELLATLGSLVTP